MNKHSLLLTTFFLLILAQLYVPASMIWSRENVLREGAEYKFKTELIDPNDPFRGKYITLNFEENTVEVENTADWFGGENIYLSLTTDPEGFAKIASVSKEKPTKDQDYLQAAVGYASGIDTTQLIIEYPFDRFYMEESKAYDAEIQFREAQRDTSQVTYALVNIKEGQAVLKDVMIEGVPVSELVKSNQNLEED